MSSREELLIMQQIKLMEEMQRKAREKEKRREEKKIRKQKAKPAWITSMVDEMSPCIEFRPSEEEFNGDPLRYIKSIAHLAAPYGACKIIPPESFRPECVPSLQTVETKQQTVLHQVDDFESGGVAFQTSHCKGARPYTIEEYRKIGRKRFKEIFGDVKDPGEKAVEAEFWHKASSNRFSVQYGSDVEGTACQDSFGPWDLRSLAKSSPLGLHDNVIPGVNTPMLYVGMLFAHFCWHYEDNALYSINYNHRGSPKIWYVVPGDYAEALEDTVKHVFRNHPRRFHPTMSNTPKLLSRKVVMCSPNVLKANGVPVYRCVQREREFIVTMPRGYHSGFNSGLHIGEAVNFALPSWISYGFLSLQRYRATGSMSCLDIERMLLEAVPRCLSDEDSMNRLSSGKTVRGCDRESLSVIAKSLIVLNEWQARMITWAEWKGWKVVEMSNCSGDADIERQLCGACNHICHMMYVEPEGNKNPNRRMCPEHSDFLGDCGAKILNVRYSAGQLGVMMSKLQNWLTSSEARNSNQRAGSPEFMQPGLTTLWCPPPDMVVDVVKKSGDCPVSVKNSFELGAENFVLRGIDGKVIGVGPMPGTTNCNHENQTCPTSPFYHLDSFPSLEALLQKDASKTMVFFRKYLIDEKPELGLTVPELHRLVAKFKQEEKSASRRDQHAPVSKRKHSSPPPNKDRESDSQSPYSKRRSGEHLDPKAAMYDSDDDIALSELFSASAHSRSSGKAEASDPDDDVPLTALFGEETRDENPVSKVQLEADGVDLKRVDSDSDISCGQPRRDLTEDDVDAAEPFDTISAAVTQQSYSSSAYDSDSDVSCGQPT